jgi:hypothetical protein
MREDYATDLKGRRFRRKHSFRREEVLADGTHKQLHFWLDTTDPSADPDQVHIAFQQQRTRILGDCRQLKTDVDSYNEFNNPKEDIQLLLDFTEDVAELEHSTEYGGDDEEGDAGVLA